MKKFSFLALAAVGLLFGACSSNEALEEAQVPSTLDGKGKGFLNISVNLPTQPVVSTRAWEENSKLDDGLATEYDVKSVLIVIFGGATEADATVQQIVSPDAETWSALDPANDQVTTRKNFVFELKKGITGPYYALAVINGNGIIDKDGEAGLKVNGTTSLGSCKISDLQKAISQAGTDGAHKFITSSGFFMTNAVLSEAKGGTPEVNSAKGFILAPVTTIFDSEAAAKASDNAPSADIYVERGVAKVTMTSTGLAFDGDVKAKTGKLPKPTLGGWVLDNTNMKSFIVRQTPTDVWSWGLASNSSAAETDKFRFVGYNCVDQKTPTVTTAYRTYWCQDPNYSTAYNKADFYEPATKTFPSDATAPQYCYENTFNVANQSYKNTTRAVVKLKLFDGDFYTFGSDRKTLYAKADADNVVKARLIMDANFQNWFAAKSTQTLDANCIKSITWSSDTKAGVIKVSDITIDGTKLKAGTDVNLSTINETIGGVDIKGSEILTAIASLYGTVKRYVGGYSYYSIRIKHFGDDLTPWGWNGEKESTIDDIYPATDRDANYLGRYGMVRNNWYELELGKILKVGSAVVPKINPDNPNPDPDDPDPENPDHPDDSLDDSFINARINILSWAKRVQTWNLK